MPQTYDLLYRRATIATAVRALVAVLIAFAALAPLAGRGAEPGGGAVSAEGAKPLRVLLLGVSDGEREKVRESLPAPLRDFLRPPTATFWSGEALGPFSQCDVILLLDASVAGISAWGDAEVEAVRRAVAEGGRGCVVLGGAAGALGGSRPWSRFLGRTHEAVRSEPGEEARGRAGERAGEDGGPEGAELPVAVVGQDRPLTQCLTHLVLPRTVATALGDEGVAALATAPFRGDGRSWGPVIWTRGERRGTVHVLALAPPREGKDGEEARELLGALAARALELAADRPLAVRLPERLPLAAESGRPEAEGTLEGFIRQEGIFLGRRIAAVMSYRGAEWLVRPDREETEAPEKVLDALRIPEGATVADLGAGVGYFAFRMARRVGPSGRVLAVDVQKEMLEILEESAEREGVANVEAILATETDPRLPPGGVDLVLMVDVYHELARPRPVLEAVRRALRRGGGESPPGRLVLVEYRGEDPTVPILPLHRLTKEQAQAELERLGFRWVENHEFLPHQRVLVFEADRGGTGAEGTGRLGGAPRVR
jgi:SAM-dependent methyltransferase